jgi:hypothetical protein
MNILKRIDHLLTLFDKYQEESQNQWSEIVRRFEIVYAKIMRRVLKPLYAKIKKEHALSINMLLPQNTAADPDRPTQAIRIGRLFGGYEKGLKCPITYGYKNIIICSNKEPISSCCSTILAFEPSTLRTPSGQLFLNIWHAAHVWRLNKKGIEWTAHTFSDDLLPEYWEWREIVMNSKELIKYAHSNEEPYILWPADFSDIILKYPDAHWDTLSPREAYQRVYCALYIKLIKLLPEFKILQGELHKIPLQIIDRRGPIREVDNLGLPIAPYEQMTHGIYGEHGVGSIPLNDYTIQQLLVSNMIESLSPVYLLGIALLGKENVFFR